MCGRAELPESRRWERLDSIARTLVLYCRGWACTSPAFLWIVETKLGHYQIVITGLVWTTESRVVMGVSTVLAKWPYEHYQHTALGVKVENTEQHGTESREIHSICRILGYMYERNAHES